MQPQVVVDTNVWIDFWRMDLLGDCALLPYALCSPPEVVDELYPEQQAQLLALANFTMQALDPAAWSAAAAGNLPKKFSVADRCVMVLAQQKQAVVWSNEKLMRQLGARWGLPVTGTLGVLDQLVQGQHCAPERAAAALQTLMRSNVYLPKSEGFALLDRWGQSPT